MRLSRGLGISGRQQSKHCLSLGSFLRPKHHKKYSPSPGPRDTTRLLGRGFSGSRCNQPPLNAVPRSRSELLSALPAGYPHDLFHDIRKDEAALNRILVVLDDDPTGTQTVHSVPVLADWPVGALAKEIESPGRYRVVYLNTNSRALNPAEAFSQYEEIARNLKEACAETGVEVTIVSRGDSTLRGHFPGDLLALEKGLCVTHDAWILAPFFQAGGRITAGDVHFVENPGTKGFASPGQENVSSILTPAGETEFARDAAFGYKSSNLVDWLREKAAGFGASVSDDNADGSRVEERVKSVVSVSLEDLRKGGPAAVRARLREAQGGCVIVNSVDQRDLQVFVKGVLEEELQGRRFLFRTAADFVATRGAVDPRPLLEREDFDALRTIASSNSDTDMGSTGGLTVVGSYVAKTTEQLEHALLNTDTVGVELRAAELVARGEQGGAAFNREVDRVRTKASLELSLGRDVILYTSRGVPIQGDGAGGLVFGERVGAALVACVAGINKRPRFLVSKGGITSSDVATKALGMTRAEVMGQILPGVPVWAMPENSRWPGMPLVVFPGNVGGKNALAEAMLKLGAKPKSNNGNPLEHIPLVAPDSTSPKSEVMYPYASGSGSGNRTLDILFEARSRRAAVGAFTVYSMESIRAVVEAAQATGRSAILQAHPAALGFQRGVPLLSAAVNSARICTASGGPLLSVQLDHGDSEDHVYAALEAGVDSVMIDGSAMSYDDNVQWTANLAAIAHARGTAVEAELGRLAGEEDGLCIAEVEAKMTDPQKVPDFLERTRADILAVTVGNVHGKYTNPDPKLDLPRLQLIRNVPARTSSSPFLAWPHGGKGKTDGGGREIEGTLLALHGASGLPYSQVQGSIGLGVCKLNVNTEVRTAAVNFFVNGGFGEGGRSAGSNLVGLLDGSVAAMRAIIEQKMLEFDPR